MTSLSFTLHSATIKTLTHKKIKELTDFGKDQVIGAIERLEKSNVIIAEKQNGKATKYFLESDFEKIKFKNKKNFVKNYEKRIKLTKKGLFLANNVFVEFI